MTTSTTTVDWDRYSSVERSLWQSYGLDPAERFVTIDAPPARLRIQEIGAGEPVLFVHGTGGTGPYWAPLVRRLSGLRCLLLDRPGFGASTPIDFSAHDYRAVTADVLVRVLDELGVERAHVVGASIGDVWALRLAQRYPDRVGRVVLLGGGPLLAEVPVPTIIRVIRSPLGALMVRLPEKPSRVESIMRSGGHGPSIDAGRIGADYFAWHVALTRDTPSLRNERKMVQTIVSRRGFSPHLPFEPAELAAITHPTLLVYGEQDSIAPVEVWKRFVGLLPHGELHLLEGGHMPWLDDPEDVASTVQRFLS